MTEEEAKVIFLKLANSFPGNNDTAGMMAEWKRYLPDQDYRIAKQAADWFVLHSGMTFMPSIAEFHGKCKHFQIQHSAAEAAKIDSAACNICTGLTWESETESTYIPCAQCREAAFARWSNGAYEAGVMMHSDEHEGPKEAHAIAAKPRAAISIPVSPARARVWRDHIAAQTNYTYPEEVPEGDIF